MHFEFTRGSGEPPDAEEIFKKSNEMEAFPYFFFLLFGKAPYIPQIMSLLPSSPKIITSAPQLLEKKNSHSPQIPKTLGAPDVLWVAKTAVPLNVVLLLSTAYNFVEK